MAKATDPNREKFRKDSDPALDAELDAALAGMEIDSLLSADRQGPAQPQTQPGADKSIRRGKIVSIGRDDVFVDFGGKSQGVCSVLQFVEPPVVGQEIDFNVTRYDQTEGVLVLSLKGAMATNVNWENLEIGQTVEAIVTGVNKGGLECEVKGMRAFMPAGQVELFHVPDFKDYIGKKLTCEVTKAEREARNLVLSRRNILEREKEESKKKMLEELAEGQIRRGTVRTVMDFGAFVDLGGIDGLLHVSEMSFKRGRKASEFVKDGDVLDVKVLKIDRDTGKLSLSLKQARGTDPWAEAGTRYGVGTPVTGRVTKVEAFGAFIEVEEGVEGLLPISEMSYTRVKSAADVCKEGDTLKLVVLSMDAITRRMSFSLKQAGPDPWKSVHERYYTEGTYPGKVTRIVDFGAFVELEPGLEGLVHVSEVAEHRVRSASEVVQPGQDVKVRVTEIDKEGRRIGLSLKRVIEGGGIAAAAMSSRGGVVAPKKDRGGLRGGLDFDYKKNK